MMKATPGMGPTVALLNKLQINEHNIFFQKIHFRNSMAVTPQTKFLKGLMDFTGQDLNPGDFTYLMH